MLAAIENEYLYVSAESAGAQLKSIKSRISGREYLWQGDERYWMGRAYNLFPIIGRMTDNRYLYEGKSYEMLIHGFIRRRELVLKEHTTTRMVFSISADEGTRAQYPFEFEFQVIFEVIGNRLHITYKVINKDKKEIIFGVGGHPGFNVPFDGGNFEDYYVEFPLAKDVRRLIMSEKCFMTGERPEYPLAEGKIPLKHELFDNDAIVLEGTGGLACVKGKDTNVTVKFSYPDMAYIGLWHKPKTDAPFLCLEPWQALPADDGVIDVFETKKDMTHLPAGQTYENTYLIEIEE